jgi:IclR family KDG regulon transcriptional repressor
MASPTNHDRRVIGSLQRALDILDLFTAQAPELGVTDIANALGLHKSTASGLVYTLEMNGYIEQNPDNRKYRLGLKLLERASVLIRQLEVREVALPHLQRLRDQTNESVNLAIRDHHEVVYVERLLSERNFGYHNEVGKRGWVHSTALGKAMLSCLPEAEALAILRSYKLEHLTPNTLTDPEALLGDLHRIRSRGYAIDDEENELGGRCTAAPILNHAGNPVAAVSVSVPLPRIPREKIGWFGRQVKEAAEGISASLGYRAAISRSG